MDLEPVQIPLQQAPPPSKRAVALEVGAVLCLGVLPFLWTAAYPFIRGHHRSESAAWVRSTTGLVMSIQIIAPLLWIMWRTGLPWRAFGFQRISPSVDTLLALLTAFLIWFCDYLSMFVIAFLQNVIPYLDSALNVLPTSGRSWNPASYSTLDWIMFTIWNITNGVAEELVCRGYLIPRLTWLTGSQFKAVVISSAVFASYHLYQGSYAAIIIFGSGMVLGGLFVATRRIWPLAIGHALYDLALAITWSGA